MLRSVLPRFELVVDRPEQAVAASLVRALDDRECRCIGWVQPPYAELHIPETERHFWSPRLQLTFIELPAGTRICGTFRPEPGVWTGFVFAHCVCAAAVLAGLSMGLAQWTLGRPPTAMLGALVAALASACLYVGALLGHGLGHEQMCALRRDFDRALGSEDPADASWDPTGT